MHEHHKERTLNKRQVGGGKGNRESMDVGEYEGPGNVDAWKKKRKKRDQFNKSWTRGKHGAGNVVWGI